jgi:hypothetical protein
MTVVKTLVCLANSKKHGGTCFAGIELNGSRPGGWIRPISSRSGHEVNLVEQILPDGSTPSVLDVVKVGVLRAVPTGFQSENWLLDSSFHWTLEGSWTFADVATLVETPPTLWTNESSSTVGIHDRVAEKHLERHNRSIGLIRPERSQVVVAANPWSRELEVRLLFTYHAVQYELKITDPAYYAHYRARGAGRYSISSGTLVTVSLAEPYTAPQPGAEAYSYKVVAAIIEPAGLLGGVA